MQKKQTKSSLTTLNVEIKEVLTQKTCAYIIIEIIKFLAHQKLQIPYAYDVLKYLVQKKRESDESNPKPNESWQSQSYFRVASSAVDVLDTIFENIILQMESEDPPDEVIILWGAIPMCAKEVYRIRIPYHLDTHFYTNHKSSSQKVVMNTLRYISLSEDLQKITHHPLAPTNMFVLLKRNNSGGAGVLGTLFLPIGGYQISNNIPQVDIRLNYDVDVSENCCRKLLIFSECLADPVIGQSEGEISFAKADRVGNQQWFQANTSLKGFKNCHVNGKSISALWENL